MTVLDQTEIPAQFPPGVVDGVDDVVVEVTGGIGEDVEVLREVVPLLEDWGTAFPPQALTVNR